MPQEIKAPDAENGKDRVGNYFGHQAARSFSFEDPQLPGDGSAESVSRRLSAAGLPAIAFRAEEDASATGETAETLFMDTFSSLLLWDTSGKP